MDISLRDIKSVIANNSLFQLNAVVENKISKLRSNKAEISHFQEQLEQVRKFIQKQEAVTNLY
jgi:predicted RNase H-like nuclease